MNVLNTSVKFDDFPYICRICLIKNNEMILLTSEILFMLSECTNILLTVNNKWPQKICVRCNIELKKVHDFKQKFIVSNEILSNVFIHYKELANQINRTNIESTIKDPTENVDIKQEDNISFKSEHDSSEINLQDILQKNVKETRNNTIEVELDNESNEGSPENETNCSALSESEQTPDIDFDIEIKGEVTLSGRQKSLADLLIKKYNIYDLTCTICKKELSTHATLLRHMETHNKNRVRKYKCPICNKQFFARENLKKHKMRHMGETKYQCDKCTTRFYVLSALGVHYRNTHKISPVMCSKCPLKFNHPLQLEQHFDQMHVQKEYVCDVCGKSFPLKSRLRNHQSAHTDEKPFSCLMCGKKFKKLNTLHEHMKLAHVETERREMCFVCGKLFLPGRLSVHLETAHTGNVYNCTKCDKSYTNKYVLNKHIKEYHSNDSLSKKRVCDICNKQLASTVCLRNHLRIAHSDAKNHSCTICGKSYKTKSHVTAHVQSAHLDMRPFNCTTCSKAFHTKSLLSKHIRSHTGERPYSCTICGKAFGFGNVLKTHMKVHSK